jgi:hypothetical protein
MIITSVNFQLHKLTHFLLHDTQVTNKASEPLVYQTGKGGLANSHLSGGCHHYSDRAAILDLCLALTTFDSKASFTCHTCDTGSPFIQFHPKDQSPRPTAGYKPATYGPSDHAGDEILSRFSLQPDSLVYAYM